MSLIPFPFALRHAARAAPPAAAVALFALSVRSKHASPPPAPDVNAIDDVSNGHFTTVGADRSRTQFDRIAGPGETCPSEVSR